MKWIILWTSGDGSSGEWETFTGTLAEANTYSTEDRRHQNYGRTGYRIVPDQEPAEVHTWEI